MKEEKKENTGVTVYLTAGQVAKQIGYSRRTVTKLCQSGRIPATKFLGHWRVAESDLLRVIEDAERTGRGT